MVSRTKEIALDSNNNNISILCVVGTEKFSRSNSRFYAERFYISQSQI